MAKKLYTVPHQIKFFEPGLSAEVIVIEPGVRELSDQVLKHPHVAAHNLQEFNPAAEAKKAADEAAEKVKAEWDGNEDLRKQYDNNFEKYLKELDKQNKKK